jgi:hypothetical protein
VVLPGQGIQAVLDAAPDGSTIVFRSGLTYTGGLQIRRGNNLTVCSLPTEGAAPGPATLVSPKDGNALMVPIGSQLKNLAIRGFVLRPPDRDPDQPGFRIDSAGDGLVILGRVDGLTIEDVDSRFFQQNIALDGDHSNVVLRRFRVAHGWAMPTAQNQFPFKGQGVYLNVPRGPVAMSDGVLVHNGWHAKLPPTARSVYRHNLYVQKESCAPAITNCAFIDGGNFGAQLRSGGTLRGCFFSGNAIHAGGFGPLIDLSDCVLLGGGRYFDGTNWTGNVGVFSWADVLRLGNVQILGLAGQSDPNPPPPNHPAARSFDGAAIALSNSYPAPHANWPSQNPQLQATDVLVAGWPGPLADLPGHVQPASLPGVITRPRPVVLLPWMPTIGADALAGRAAAATLIKLARQAAP